MPNTIKGVEIDPVKEKLIELIRDAKFDVDRICVERDWCDGCPAAYGEGNCKEAYIADNLIANGVTVQEWISVKDRLPIEEAKAHEQEWCEEYCEFLVMIERGLLPTTLYYDWEENEWFRINTALERETYKVTHWQCLPQPPKGE